MSGVTIYNISICRRSEYHLYITIDFFYYDYVINKSHSLEIYTLGLCHEEDIVHYVLFVLYILFVLYA